MAQLEQELLASLDQPEVTTAVFTGGGGTRPHSCAHTRTHVHASTHTNTHAHTRARAHTHGHAGGGRGRRGGRRLER